MAPPALAPACASPLAVFTPQGSAPRGTSSLPPPEHLQVAAAARRVTRGTRSLAFSPASLLRQSPRLLAASALKTPSVAFGAAVAGQEGFAQEETAKFLRDLPPLVEREAPGGGDAHRAATVCAQPLSAFLVAYEGQIVPEPFAEMMDALLAAGIPRPYAEAVLRCALGWARTNLHTDWSKWSKAQ